MEGTARERTMSCLHFVLNAVRTGDATHLPFNTTGLSMNRLAGISPDGDLLDRRSVFAPAWHIFRLKPLAELPIRHKLNSARGRCVNELTHENRIRLVLLDDQALF